MDKLKAYHLQQFYKRMIDTGRLDDSDKPLGTASIIYHHRVIHRLLEVAYRQEIINKNIADLVELPIPNDDDSDEKDKVAILTPEQVKILETAVKDSKKWSKYYSLIFVSVRTGLRRGELLGLKWGDFNIIDEEKKKSTLSVRRSLAYTPELGTFFKGPKNKNSKRTIDLSKEVFAFLKQHHKKQSEIKLKHTEYHDDDLIFCRRNGKPMHPDTVSSWFPVFLSGIFLHNKCGKFIEKQDFCPNCERKLSKEDVITLPRLNWHALRHTHASLLLDQGEDIKLISARLGHSTIRITYDLYSHLMPNKQEEAVNRLDEILK